MAPSTANAATPWHLPSARWYAAAALAIGVCGLWLDIGIAQAMRGAPPGFVQVFQAITWTGDSAYSLVPIGLCGIVALAAWLGLRGRPGAAEAAVVAQACGFLFAAIAGSGLLVNVLKQVIGRSRPILLETIGYHGFEPFAFTYAFQSFPSGHTNTLFAAAVALGLLAPRLRWPLLVGAALLASSRTVIGAHYLSDVIGGAALAYVTTLWLRDRMAERGWLFAPAPGGRIGLGPAAMAVRTSLLGEQAPALRNG